MKRTFLLLCLVLYSALTVLSGCGNISDTPVDSHVDASSNETTEQSAEASDTTVNIQDAETTATIPENDDEYRVLVTSDLHYTVLARYYSMNRDTRLQYWLDGILAEHERDPFDLIVILGDVSLDYWGWNNGGVHQRFPDVSETKSFVEKYLPKLPEGVPVFVLPGNHELYSNDEWKEITGNNRNESFVLGDNLFIMPDSYGGVVDPEYVGNGVNDAPYTPVDVDFINEVIDSNPDCKNIFLMSHYFDFQKESDEFRQLLKDEKRIVGLFAGHSHDENVRKLNDYGYIDLTIAQTGNFASNDSSTVENFNWGFRDIKITPKRIYSTYITPECKYTVNSVEYTVKRTISDIAAY